MATVAIANEAAWHALRERIQRDSMPEPNTGCWLWYGAWCSAGYGSLHLADQTMAAHRVSFEAFNERPLTREHVLHRCDTPCCVNPAHLFLGDNAANVADRVAKGRSARIKGMDQGRAKLTDADVLAILSDPRSHSAIAAQYGISTGPVFAIKSGRRWQHVTHGGMDRRGSPKGERVGGAKLNDALVRSIRADRRPQHAIAKDHGVCQMTVSLVKRRKVWAHVGD